MGFGYLLNVIDAVNQRVVIELAGADLQHMQNNLRILRVIFIPAVMQRLAGPRERNRGNELVFATRLMQSIGDIAMIVAVERIRSTLKTDAHGHTETVQDGDEAIEIFAFVLDR